MYAIFGLPIRELVFGKNNITLPFISLIFFVLAIVFKSLQKQSNNRYYWQNKILKKPDESLDSVSSFFLYYLDVMGVNSFFDDVNSSLATGIIILLITYLLLALVEINIGHVKIFFFLLIIILYNTFARSFTNTTCKTDFNIDNSPFCCGSFILFATVGCLLAIMLLNSKKLLVKLIICFIILLTYGSLVLYDYYSSFAADTYKIRQCIIYYWHAMNFVFGVISGLALKTTF